MFVPLLYCALQLSAPNAVMPDRLIGDTGVDYVQDPQVFSLFAALNAAGYSAELTRAAPPLDAPVYDPIRVKLRDALRAPAAQAALKPLRAVFAAHPAPIASYLEATLSDAPKAAEARALQQALRPALAKFTKEARLTALADALAEAAREESKALKEAVDQDLPRAEKLLGEPLGRTALKVIVNPLDAHGSLRRLQLGGGPVLVVGPGVSSGRMGVLSELVAAKIAAPAARAYAKTRALQARYRSERLREERRYNSGADYFAHALGWGVAKIVRGSGSIKPAEGTRYMRAAGMRWQAAPAFEKLRPLSKSLPRIAKLMPRWSSLACEERR